MCFLQARQHGGCYGVTNCPCLISEYGDWEYYAQNAGLAQEKWKDLKPAERGSRQLRGDGEARLLQQARNFQEAHNDNLQTPAIGDGLWVMFDYSRGYAPDLETSGVMDVFRLPKYGYWFFRSQRDAGERVAGKKLGPVLFLATGWTTNSPADVSVFSNCEEVALYLNGRLIGRRRPDTSRLASHLKHPPFIFPVPGFQAGTVKAVGFIKNRQVAVAERRTPGPIARLEIQFDIADHAWATSENDVVLCHATLKDQNGTPVPLNGGKISFTATGSLQVLGPDTVVTEAGTATVLVAGTSASGKISARYAPEETGPAAALTAAALTAVATP